LETTIISQGKVLGIALLPTLILFFILIQLFPYTGLERIVALPLIFCLNATIIFVAITLLKNSNNLHYKLVLGVIVLLTIIITVALYPQPGGPSVFKQIANSISAINQYDQITIQGLNLPLEKTYSSHNGDPERYVVSLYKYRKDIPLDGSYHIYRENELDELKYWKDTSITNTDEIPNKLEGHHKVIWWYLKTFK
jgi:hypothetical protein